MSHDHHHHNGHDDHGSHAHGVHSHDSKKYSLAGWVGVGGFLVEGGVGLLFGSVAAVSDALHAMMDAGSFFVSSAYAKKHTESGSARDYEKDGVIIQTVLLAVAVGLIVVNMLLGKPIIEFNSLGMFGAGFVGLGFNVAQMVILGRSRGSGMSLHEAARQHAFYDVLYSCAVIHGASLIFMADTDVGDFAKVAEAFGLAAVFAVAFPALRFVDFEHMKRKAGYVCVSFIAGAVSSVLVLLNNSRMIDLAIGMFLSLAMIGSIVINCVALKTWNKGGRTLAHVH